MASIDRKKGTKRWRVRWRQPNGEQCQRTVAGHKNAKLLQQEIEVCVSKGRPWKPDTRVAPALVEVADAYLTWSRRIAAAGTVEQRAVALTIFCEWVKHKRPNCRLGLEWLDVPVLEEHYDYLIEGRGISRLTANDRVRLLCAWWRWVYERKEYRDFAEFPVRIVLPDARPALVPDAPTWAEMDQAIDATKSWYRHLFIVLRFTGLRPGQAMRLEWRDFDFDRKFLRIRPELGKTKQERSGRLVPVSSHLIDELATWGPREGLLVDCGRAAPQGRHNSSRTIHRGAAKAIWLRTGLQSTKFRQPCHCFRKGFISELARAGVDGDVRKHLVGHATGVHGDVYTVYWARERALREAVAMIPAVGELGQILPLSKAGGVG